MQTFLPYPDVRASIGCLDDRRCWKQAVEAWQVLRALADPRNRWNAHPVVKMWRGYEQALTAYYNEALAESLRRGVDVRRLSRIPRRGRYALPPWWGGEIHRTHRANLLRKDPVFYGRYGWRESPRLAYHWPAPIAGPPARVRPGEPAKGEQEPGRRGKGRARPEDRPPRPRSRSLLRSR